VNRGNRIDVNFGQPTGEQVTEFGCGVVGLVAGFGAALVVV
jgi:hypothetical protein